MQLNNITWEEAHWLRYAVVSAAREVAEGSLAMQSYIDILNKLNAAEQEALATHGVDRNEILQGLGENCDPTLLNPESIGGDCND